MINKSLRVLLAAFLICGLTLAVFNVLSVGAPYDWGGEITHVPGSTPNPDNPAHLYDDYWCLGAVLNCFYVIVN
jgi:hypothetical protein